MRRWALRLALMGGLSVVSVACTSSSNVFTCASDTDCTGEGVGTCQSNGFCAFPDAMCDSGSRYGELAGGGFANMCVPQDGSNETDPAADSTSSTSSDPPTTTGVTTSDGSSSETGILTESSTAASTGGPAECEVLFRDDFEDEELFPDWEMVGTGAVDFFGGRVDLTPTPQAGDQPTWLRSTEPVRFEGGWVRVEISDVPGADGIQAIISLTHQNEVRSYDIVVDGGSDQISARVWDAEGFTDLQTVSFEKFDTPWVGIREADGQVVFERGESENAMVPFFAVDADVSDWLGRFYIGADNFLDLPRSLEVSYEEAAACVLR